MQYKFLLEYAPTEGTAPDPRTVRPIYGDSLRVIIARANDEWYYTRRIEGDIIFHSQDYDWLMSQPFDGTFTLTIRYSTNNGSTWNDYFSATFARTNLTIDEDNHKATLSGLTETAYNTIENGKDEEYDLRKIIPDYEAREVQGRINPALAMVDFRDKSILTSDIFCGGAFTSGGYQSRYTPDFDESVRIADTPEWSLVGIFAEAKYENSDHPDASGTYIGLLSYRYPSSQEFLFDCYIGGYLHGPNGYEMYLGYGSTDDSYSPTTIRRSISITSLSDTEEFIYDSNDLHDHVSPATLVFPFARATFSFHYIRAALLTRSGGAADNVLDTGNFYQRMAAFNNSDNGLHIYASTRTVEQPNGHRLVPGTGEQGTTPQYFAPPNNDHDYIPLAEDNWNYGSLWYTIVPSETNGLTKPDKVGTFSWSACWTLGTILRYLLEKITDGKVTFEENSYGSRFFYDPVNPVASNEPFDYLFTQKRNVMSTGESGTRCIVRLNWLLKLLRNAFNCYYWLEPLPYGRYSFRVEHVEYFRHGGRYEGDLSHAIDLTSLMPRKNFFRNNAPVKCLADQTNHYSYDLKDLSEKYTFSWQGEGGSDDFKGNPMFFKAGWIEKASSEDHQVDNIFTDLNWLLLNAGTSTASSKNYDGLFLFATYRPIAANHTENTNLTSPLFRLAYESRMIYVAIDLWLTAPQGTEINLVLRWNTPQPGSSIVQTYTATGDKQCISVVYEYAFIVPHSLALDFGSDYAQVVIHRIHARSGNVYCVANTPNLLHPSTYLQNAPLAWPTLQNEYLHYDIPAQRWSFDTDDPSTAQFLPTGTVKMAKRQEVKILPIPDYATEQQIMNIIGIRTGIGTGIITSATINLASRNAELTIVYDPIPNNQ